MKHKNQSRKRHCSQCHKSFVGGRWHFTFYTEEGALLQRYDFCSPCCHLKFRQLVNAAEIVARGKQHTEHKTLQQRLYDYKQKKHKGVSQCNTKH